MVIMCGTSSNPSPIDSPSRVEEDQGTYAVPSSVLGRRGQGVVRQRPGPCRNSDPDLQSQTAEVRRILGVRSNRLDHALCFDPRPCSARASAVTAFAVFSTSKPEPRRLVHTLVNSAPKRRICAE